MTQVEKGNLQKGIESLNKALELIKVWLRHREIKNLERLFIRYFVSKIE